MQDSSSLELVPQTMPPLDKTFSFLLPSDLPFVLRHYLLAVPYSLLVIAVLMSAIDNRYLDSLDRDIEVDARRDRRE